MHDGAHDSTNNENPRTLVTDNQRIMPTSKSSANVYDTMRALINEYRDKRGDPRDAELKKG